MARLEPRSPNGPRAELAAGSPAPDPQAISRPTFLVSGTADALAHPEVITRFFAQLAMDDKALVVIRRAGHFLLFQRPRWRFAALVRDFLLAEETSQPAKRSGVVEQHEGA
ncbi:MAG: hypothetical protein K6U89_13790 [Chloroflexi bacterium]|nr:hypothetical protein [Chloroflexota bacterium]